MVVPDPQSWVTGFLLGVPILGGLWASRVATHNRIDKAHAEAEEAKAECDKIRLELSNGQLKIHKDFASVTHLNEVKADLKAEMNALETRLIHAIKGT